MHPSDFLSPHLARAFSQLYQQELPLESFQLTPTRKEFVGDYTLLIFPLIKYTGKGPEPTGAEIGEWLLSNSDSISGYNVIKGFLNLTLNPDLWHRFTEHYAWKDLVSFPPLNERVLIEYSSPNTNKPLHLGHIRNILLGWASSRILKRVGYEVVKVQVINDRGIAICKSMLSWLKFGNGQTPETSGIKGDHFVGKYYVAFETAFREEYQTWQSSEEARALLANRTLEKDNESQGEDSFFKAYKNDYFNSYSLLGKQAREMLLAWENDEPEVRSVWNLMNGWVYSGFDKTYDRLGVNFDRVYRESETYILGNDLIDNGLEEGVFYQKVDGSVWVDLTSQGLDHKILRRSDGTSLYITQDLGTAEERYRDFHAKRMVYVVADEQNYHFQVLFAVMKLLKAPFADGMFHLSYGMVELPTGRMKSREGTVVDADDLMDEVIAEAENAALERGESHHIPIPEQKEIYRKVGLAAMKFHIIKVNPRKRMIFDPKESVDMQGHTGPYIQNAYVRIQSILQKTGHPDPDFSGNTYAFAEGERDLLVLMGEYKATIVQAADQYDPSHIANYAYTLAKAFHKFYHEFQILRAESEDARQSRLAIATATGRVLKDAMELLGIEMPERM